MVNVEIDLDGIGAMHPNLQRVGEADVYRRRAAIALHRAQHQPGVGARVVNGSENGQATIRWTRHADGDDALKVLDENRVTEDGAEAIALSFVHVLSRWTVSRRVQREGSADWLLTGPSHHKMALALEVSGVAVGGAEQRLKVKCAQVARVTEPCVRAAVVVGFEEPCILAATAEGERLP